MAVQTVQGLPCVLVKTWDPYEYRDPVTGVKYMDAFRYSELEQYYADRGMHVPEVIPKPITIEE